MKLIYLSETNLRDSFFIKDLIHHFKFAEKTILIHDTFGSRVEDTRFVTKRISSLFSEAMVYNNAFSADQRNFFSKEGTTTQINVALINKVLDPIQLLIIGPIMASASGPQLAQPLEMLTVARQAFEVDELILFPAKPKSPLVANKIKINSEEDKIHWLNIYGEESDAIQLAYTLRPASLASPTNYSM